MVEYLIIGAGLFGSAAARYLSTISDSVTVVGPFEPANWAKHTGVFASHYDETRIVSQSAPDEVWEYLDRASINQYQAIEEKSGIRFFAPVGRISALSTGEIAAYPYLAHDEPHCHLISHEDAQTRFGLNFPSEYDIVFEDAPSGYLNPRAMVDAQLAVALSQGARRIPHMANQVELCQSHVCVTLSNGHTVTAKKVLLAAGSFSNCFNLVSRELALKVESNPTILVRVSENDAGRMRKIPPINFRTSDRTPFHLSILPPRPYADGCEYLKIVITSNKDRILANFDEMLAWFHSDESPVQLPALLTILQSLLPDVQFLGWKMKPCVATHTPSGKPMIDQLVEGKVFVAVAGNGGGAHPSDTIGKIAADLLSQDRWPPELPREPFMVRFKEDWQTWMQTPTLLWQP